MLSDIDINKALEACAELLKAGRSNINMKFDAIDKLMYKIKDSKNIIWNFIIIAEAETELNPNVNLILFLKDIKNYIGNLIKIYQIWLTLVSRY